MTIPNFLTLSRILLTPVLVWLLLDRRMNQALAVFFVAGVTDGLDGLIARLFHQKSQLGAYLDPLADKLLLVTSFFLLAWLDLIPYWLAIIAISRDAMILLGMMTLMFHRIEVDIKPVLMSKLTTLFQLLTVLAAMGSSLVVLPAYVYGFLFLTTAAFSVVSGIQYLKIGLSIFEGHRSHNGRP
ncbi:MAG: CDP-alcohol phosphatidyltransferase family protein [Syntrophobacteraceae bacterium]|nr:CDP-alcohol phosphatidyltransferase family protein [Desulfobacteraceae bacterium]